MFGCGGYDIRQSDTGNFTDLGSTCATGDATRAYVKAEKEDDLEILLHIPQGMVVDSKKLGVQNKRQHALKLQKGSYGLKESGRLWNLMFHYIFDVFGFQSMLHGQFSIH